MSYLAIGAVTQAVAELLAKKLNKPPLMGATATFTVTTLPPDDDRVYDADGVNLFLYRVTESPFAKNVDWRGDRANPSGVKRPPLALTLHYFLTAYAKKSTSTQDDITAHKILGNAMAILHEHPVLNDVHDSDFDANLNTHFAAELRNSFEKVKISHVPISMDDFSKVWTGLSKAYRLSVAYEVSLVQIAPIVPAPMPGPPVQQTNLQVVTISPPFITAIAPSTGAAGIQVTLRGRGFKLRGFLTSVTVGDTTLAEIDLEKLTEEEIVLTIPAATQQGPKLRIAVSVGDRESAPAFYEVNPWISFIQPLRGITGIPLTIPFDRLLSVEIDGQAATTTFDAENKLIRAIVPTTITPNRPKSVVVTVDGARSNARLYEVLPSIASVVVAESTTGPLTTTVTITGRRLEGNEVNIKYGDILLKKGKNTTPLQVQIRVQRSLPSNQPVSVVVDGHESNTLPPSLDEIEPAQAFAGDMVTLIGRSLSGQNVVVSFGATTVNVGPHAYASRLNVQVPSALAAGSVDVKVAVDGIDTNVQSFEVIA